MQFRTGRTAVMCDIEKMFHQFHSTSANRDYLWFLWITSEHTTECTDWKYRCLGLNHRLDVPSMDFDTLRHKANYTKNYLYIRLNFYVDNGLTSGDHTEDIIELLPYTSKLCKHENISLDNFVSNNLEMLQVLPQTEVGSATTGLIRTNDHLHRTLGLQWNNESDTFSHNSEPFAEAYSLTLTH